MNILILIFIIAIIIIYFDKKLEHFDYGVGSESFAQTHNSISQREQAISLLY
jgi:hypothetical protein